MACLEFEIELDSRHFQVSAFIDVSGGAVRSIELDDVSELIDDDGPNVRADISPSLRMDLCSEVERLINDQETLRDLEDEDREAAREAAVDSQISARKEGY